MGAPELRTAAWSVAVLAVLTLSGCASDGKSSGSDSTIPPQTVVPSPSAADPTASPGSAPPQAAAPSEPQLPSTPPAPRLPSARAEGDPTLVIIDAARPENDPAANSLAAVAAKERERRQREGAPSLVINNQNLAGYAAGGVLTIAQGEAPARSAEQGKTDAAPAGGPNSEAYWRQRGLEIRQRWHDAVDRIPKLESRAAELRNRFYATDDPAVRDGQIKPEWDRALADLEQARYQAARGAEEVASFLEEGRRAGAMPGWLREGAELEPEPVLETTENSDLSISEPGEPTIYSQPPVEPPPVSPRS